MPSVTSILLFAFSFGLLTAPLFMRLLLAAIAVLVPLAAAVGLFLQPGAYIRKRSWLRWGLLAAGAGAAYGVWCLPATATATWAAGLLTAFCAVRLIRAEWARSGGDMILRLLALAAATGMLILDVMLLYRHNPIGFLAAADLYGGFCGLLGLTIWVCTEKKGGK